MSGSEMEFGGSSFRDGSFRNSDSKDLKEQSFNVSSFRDWSLLEGMFYCVRWAHALMFFFGGGAQTRREKIRVRATYYNQNETADGTSCKASRERKRDHFVISFLAASASISFMFSWFTSCIYSEASPLPSCKAVSGPSWISFDLKPASRITQKNHPTPTTLPPSNHPPLLFPT